MTFDSVRGTDSLFENSVACLAPMAGYTDAPFRALCREFGSDFSVTEMVSADGIVRGGERSFKTASSMDGEGPVGIQLFGSDPETIARAASTLEGSDPAFIDLNFGCPVRKVIKRNGGVALMRDIRLLRRICRETVRSVGVPVTVKTRSGWNREEENYIEVGLAAQDAGVSAVAIHPRYGSQGFSGEAHGEHIAGLREALSIPVIASGVVADVEDYEAVVRATGCSLVMIGRGALGHPWIFSEIKTRLAGTGPVGTGLGGLAEVIERHARTKVAWKGERLGILEMRKHYRWYLRGIPEARRYRSLLCGVTTLSGVRGILGSMREELNGKWRKPA